MQVSCENYHLAGRVAIWRVGSLVRTTRAGRDHRLARFIHRRGRVLIERNFDREVDGDASARE